jgi:hypothetical protein
MGKVIFTISMSLDGFVTASNQTPDQPMGDGWERLQGARAMTHTDLAAHARELLDINRYLTLGTVDPGGRPWTCPVYFAAAGEREHYWMSMTDAVGEPSIAR